MSCSLATLLVLDTRHHPWTGFKEVKNKNRKFRRVAHTRLDFSGGTISLLRTHEDGPGDLLLLYPQTAKTGVDLISPKFMYVLVLPSAPAGARFCFRGIVCSRCSSFSLRGL